MAAAKIMTTIGLIAPLPFSCCLAECIRVFITGPLQQFISMVPLLTTPICPNGSISEETEGKPICI